MRSTHKSLPRGLALLGLLFVPPGVLFFQSSPVFTAFPALAEVYGTPLLARPAPGDTGSEADVLTSSRKVVLLILQDENACSVWFRRSDPQVVSTFLSLNYRIEKDGPQYVTQEKASSGDWLEFGPYIARAIQDSGPGATVTINANGAFFHDRGDIYRLNWPGGIAFETGNRRYIHVGPYQGGTLRAQVLALLHELAHVVGAIPEDSSSRFGPRRSQKNTEIIVQRCKRTVDSIVRTPGSS
jgi:hypothetical protein